MIKAIAIDDEPPALTVISSFCERSKEVELKRTFNRTDEALEFLQNESIELVFLDINMPSVSGLDFYRSISKEHLVVFTTAHTQYAVEGFNLDAVDYLLKPFTYDRFLKAIQKVKERIELSRHKADQGNELIVPSGYTTVRIPFYDILYVQAFDDYLKIFISTSPHPVVTRMTMKILLEKLSASDFIRVHRSYIVSLRKINKASSKSIFVGAAEIPIGKMFSKEFFQKFK